MIIIVSVISLILDIGSKYYISKNFIVYESKTIIKNFLDITYVKNTGAAFSILKDNTWMITIISLMIIMGVIYYIYKNKPSNNIENIGYGMVIGGALGNFIDRIIYGYVIDFIDIYIFSYDYPIFNIAYIGVVIGIILILITSIKESSDKNETNSNQKRKNR